LANGLREHLPKTAAVLEKIAQAYGTSRFGPTFRRLYGTCENISVDYALLEPRLTALLAWWLGGLVFGLAPLVVYWFVVLPLKGFGIGGGFHLAMVPIEVGFHAIFGIGTAIIFRSGLVLARRRFRASPEALHG